MKYCNMDKTTLGHNAINNLHHTYYINYSNFQESIQLKVIQENSMTA